MSDFYQFADGHPWLAFLFAILAYELVAGLFVILPNRLIRHLNIRKSGWPPAHCDADGDSKP